MINELIDGISIRLNEVFGDGYRIYSEVVAQGLQEPCFFISVLDPSLTPIIGARYRAVHPFVVHYFPAGPNKSADIHDTAARLFGGLQMVDFAGGRARGTQMSYVISDEVLQFFVNYNLIVTLEQAAAERMQSLTVNNNVGR